MQIWRLFLRLWFVKYISNFICGSAFLAKSIEGIDKEYKDNDSWQKGKKETIGYLLVCIIFLVILSCLIH